MKNKNKIVTFIANGFGLSPVLSGGEVRLFNLLKRIKNEFTPVLFTTIGGEEALKTVIKKVNFKVIRIKCSLFLKKEFFPLQRFSGYLISAYDTFLNLKKFLTDAVYTSSDAICDVLPAYFLKKEKNNVRWFAMLHHKYKNPFLRPGNFFKNFFLFLMQNFTLKLIAKKADFVFVLRTYEGELLKNHLIKNGFKGRIIKVKNGINIEKKFFKKISKKNKTIAVFAGGIRAAKGLYDIVPIWEKVISNNKNLKLIIIGKGSEKDMDYMKNEIKNKNLEKNIIVKGYVSEKELKKFLKIAFIFFLPSHEEGWGISVLEALMYGCIPVLYELPAFKIFKKNAIFIPCFDRDLYAKKLLEIFNNKINLKIDKNFIYKFSWDEILNKEIKFIKSKI